MTTEVLPLREAPGHAADDCAARPIAGNILQSFREMFAHSEIGSEHAPLDTELSRQAAALESARGPAAIGNAGRLVSATCKAAVAIVVRRQAVRHRDIASLVAIVRETVDSLAAGHAVASSALGESTNRLDDLQQVGEFSRLRELLASEVVTLRRIAADREQAHQQTVATLRERVSMAEQQLSAAREEARLDPLTDVANRRAFDAVLAGRVKAATPTSTLVLALFDVDGFKAMNDQFGHPAGDTNDTGPMHIATAVGTRVIDMSSGRVCAHETGPYGEGNLVVEPEMACYPCALDSECHHFACRTAVMPADAAGVVRYALGHGPLPVVTGGRVLQARRVGPTGRIAFQPVGSAPTIQDAVRTAAAEVWEASLRAPRRVGDGWMDVDAADRADGGAATERDHIAQQLAVVALEAETAAARARALPKASPVKLQRLANEVQASLEKLLAIGESTRATHVRVTHLRHEIDSIAAVDLAGMAHAQAAAYTATAARARGLADRMGKS